MYIVYQKKDFNENSIFTTSFHYSLQAPMGAYLRGHLFKKFFFSKMCSQVLMCAYLGGRLFQ